MPDETPTKFTLVDIINDVKERLVGGTVPYIMSEFGVFECQLPAFPSTYNSLYIVNPGAAETCLEIHCEYGNSLSVCVRPDGPRALYTMRESEATFEGMSDVLALALKLRPEFLRALGVGTRS